MLQSVLTRPCEPVTLTIDSTSGEEVWLCVGRWMFSGVDVSLNLLILDGLQAGAVAVEPASRRRIKSRYDALRLT